MRRSPVLILALGVLTFESGCANTAALETELSRLRRELHFIRQDLAKQKRSVEGLERRLTLVSLGKAPAPAPDADLDGPDVRMVRPGPVGSTPVARTSPLPAAAEPAPAPRRAQPRQKALPVVRLGANARPKAAKPEEWVDPGAQDDGGPPLKFTMEGDEADGDRLPVDRSVLEQPDPVLDRVATGSEPDNRTVRGRPSRSAPPPAAEAQRPAAEKRRTGRASKAEIRSNYQAALARLRENKQPKVALEMFDAFLLAYPKSKFADNAAYWRGECFYALGKHGQAITAFDVLIRMHPKSPKVPFALVRKGESLIAIGQAPAAKEAFKTVVERHADSEAAQTAKRLLAKLGSGQ